MKRVVLFFKVAGTVSAISLGFFGIDTLTKGTDVIPTIISLVALVSCLTIEHVLDKRRLTLNSRRRRNRNITSIDLNK